MKITVISDTHNQHAELGTLSGDVLIHCGDMFNLFGRDDGDLQRIDDWFGQQNFDLILCTGGNHDLLLEARTAANAQPFKNATYLQDRKFVHAGITFYGAPWVPELRSHAFYHSDTQLQEKWSRIPDDTDVLITHTPQISKLDVSSRGLSLGCEHLAAASARVKPRVHCFGHVHNSAGVLEEDGTVYVNASSVNSRFQIAHPPRVVKL